MKLSNAQVSVLEVLREGFSVSAEAYPNPNFYKAICNEIPRLSYSTLNALVKGGLIGFTEDAGLRKFFIIQKEAKGDERY